MPRPKRAAGDALAPTSPPPPVPRAPRPPPMHGPQWTRATLEAGAAHLAAAHPILAAAVARHGIPFDRLLPPRYETPAAAAAAAFESLARSIFAQQVSSAAAASIGGRVVAAVGGALTPAAVLATPADELRGAGLSARKVEYVSAVAAAFDGGLYEATLAPAAAAGDVDAVRSALTAVRGLGPWSADMFTLFHLKLADCMPAGDLGVRKGVAKVFGLDVGKGKPPPPPARVHELTRGWAPYRSLGAFYCWRLEGLSGVP